MTFIIFAVDVYIPEADLNAPFSLAFKVRLFLLKVFPSACNFQESVCTLAHVNEIASVIKSLLNLNMIFPYYLGYIDLESVTDLFPIKRNK